MWDGRSDFREYAEEQAKQAEEAQKLREEEYAKEEALRQAKYKKQKRLIAGGVVGIIAVIALLLSITFIPTGKTGIVTTFGKVENTTLEAGVHFTAPWQNVIKMDNRIQVATVDLLAFSKDTQEVSMKYTINYQISAKDAMTIYKTIGKDYFPVVVSPNVMESIKNVTAKFTAEDLIANRADLAKQIEDDLSVKLKVNNVILVSTSIEDIDFSDPYTNAVEAKQVAYQKKLQAEAEAETKIVNANASAEAKKIEADAQAYVNEVLTESLNDKILTKMYYEKWNGVLPQVVSDGSTVVVTPNN